MWHYVQNGQGFGPVDVSVMQSLLKNGSLAPEALVWKDGMKDWVPARSIAEFAAHIPAASGAGAPRDVPPISMPPKNPSGSASDSTGNPPNPGASPAPDPVDVEKNRVYAILAYLSILFVVPLLMAPHSRFARYHANQGIILFITMLVVSMCRHVPVFGGMMWEVHSFLWLVLSIFMVLGIVHAASGQLKPLPFIGDFEILEPV